MNISTKQTIITTGIQSSDLDPGMYNVSDIVKNLKIQIDDTLNGSSITTLKVSADLIVIHNSSGATITLSNYSFNSNIVPAAYADNGNWTDNWYSLYIMYNPTTLDTILRFSTTATDNPLKPQGYDYFARLGNFYRKSAIFAGFVGTKQYNNYAIVNSAYGSCINLDGSLSIDAWTLATAGSSMMVPPLAKTLKYAIGSSGAYGGMASNSNGDGGFFHKFAASGSGVVSMFNTPTARNNWLTGEVYRAGVPSQSNLDSIYYYVGAATSTVILIGWSL